jgi:hypothetical protein
VRADHSYAADKPCRACKANFPWGSSGCHRRRDGVYEDDPDSQKNKVKKGANLNPDPYSGE